MHYQSEKTLSPCASKKHKSMLIVAKTPPDLMYRWYTDNSTAPAKRIINNQSYGHFRILYSLENKLK